MLLLQILFILSGYFANAWLLRMLVVVQKRDRSGDTWRFPPSVELKKSKLSKNFGIAFFSVGFAEEKVNEDGMFCTPTVDE